MAENNPPATANANATANSDASRGMPYYEKLRRDLRETLQKKRVLDQQIAATDEQIYRLESSYLEETSSGNIIKGFDNYMKGTTTTTASAGAGTATRRKGGFTEADRIFSRSSASFMMKDSPEPSSNQTTPSHAPTPNSSFAQSARESNHPTPGSTSTKTGPTNKKKKLADDDEDNGKPAKRGKVAW